MSNWSETVGAARLVVDMDIGKLINQINSPTLNSPLLNFVYCDWPINWHKMDVKSLMVVRFLFMACGKKWISLNKPPRVQA